MAVEIPASVVLNNVEIEADPEVCTPGIGTDDYSALANKPSINGNVLVGDKSTADLGIDHVPLADNLVATTGSTDTTPYVSRASQGPIAELRKVVGGTLAWNQLVQNGNFASSTGWNARLSTISVSGGVATVTPSSDGTQRGLIAADTASVPIYANHKYLLSIDVKSPITGTVQLSYNGITSATVAVTANTWVHAQGIWSTTSDVATGKFYALIMQSTTTSQTIQYKNANAFDLTQMFGSAIADAIATMESTAAGSGVAFFRSLFPESYYPYSAPSLESVQTSARQALDGNGNVMRSYPFDSDLTLRGLPKLTNGQLSYDGDIYLPTGEVTRRYHEFDLGAVTFTLSSVPHVFTYRLSSGNTDGYPRKYGGDSSGLSVIVPGYTFFGNGTSSTVLAGLANMQVGSYQTTETIAIRNDSCDTAAELKTALNGVHIVYELATPTTEQAAPYTEVQLAGTTEQFVCDNYIPVGNESFYSDDLTNVVQNLAPLPTTAGEYKLKVTVTGGVPSYSWVAG